MNLADEQYVSLTTYRRNGEAVSTPVWIAPLSMTQAGFTTASDSGKVKRLAHTDSVTLRPCNSRGTVAEGTSAVTATAHFVADGPDHDAVAAAIRSKYGAQARLVGIGGTIRNAVSRGRRTTGSVLIDLSF